MQVGIIGSGAVGRALGTGFAARGHEVMIGSREPQRPELIEWQTSAGSNASTGSNRQTAAFGELIVFCTRWTGAANAVELAGPENFAGKIVIDTTNPIGSDEAGHLVLTLGRDSSAAETLQSWLPGAHVIKAFNYVGNSLMVDPRLADGPPSGFLCGDDEPAREVVAGILRDFGFEPVDLGGLIEARAMEPLVLLWMAFGRSQGRWDHALKMLTG